MFGLLSMPARVTIFWPPLLAAVLACACGSPPDDSPAQQAQERLVGTWLREYKDDSASVRRVLVLAPDGSFREMASVSGTGIPLAEHVHLGAWHFDGTNLKRRYTQMDGKQPSAPIVPFATFEVRFQSRDEFIGVDNVHRRQVHYRRVGEGTTP